MLLVGMHLGIWAVMNLTFSANTYLLVILGYPWPYLIDLLLHRLDARHAEQLRRLSMRLA